MISITLIASMSDVLFYFEKKDKYVHNESATVKWWQCSRKKPYTSFIKATNTMIKFKGAKNKNYHVYECPHCYFWHIGRKRKEDY